MNSRRSQPGDYRVLQGEIDKLRREAGDLERHHAEISTALKVELAKDAQWFNEWEVREHRHNLNQIEQRQALISDRIAALEGRLPTPEQRRDAEREAKVLLDAATAADQKFTSEWTRFVTGLEETAAIGAELVAARTDARAAVYPLADLVAKAGLDVTVLDVPEPPKSDASYAGLLATQLRHVGYFGEFDATTARDLTAERTKRTREKVSV